METKAYEILGVKREATVEEVTKAYRLKSLVIHPDKRPDNEKERAQKEFAELSKCYELLKDPQARAAIDELIDAQTRKRRAKETKMAGMDKQRERMAEELDRREQEARAKAEGQRQYEDEIDVARKRLQAEIEKVKQRKMAERQAKLRQAKQQFARPQKKAAPGPRWNKDMITKDMLERREEEVFALLRERKPRKNHEEPIQEPVVADWDLNQSRAWEDEDIPPPPAEEEEMPPPPEWL